MQLHNQLFGTAYSVKEYGDSPDAVCCTSHGETFNVEVCLTEDCPGDIPWIFGRKNERPGKSKIGSCLSVNVLQQLFKRLKKKTLMRYGTRSALVIRDSSGVDWDWEYVKEQIQAFIMKSGNPFDMGIWIVNRMKSRLHRIA